MLVHFYHIIGDSLLKRRNNVNMYQYNSKYLQMEHVCLLKCWLLLFAECLQIWSVLTFVACVHLGKSA